MTTAILPLLMLSVSPAAAQTGTTPVTAKQAQKKAAAPVFVCKGCKAYVDAATAKKMGYKDPMGHKLTKMPKAPAGFTDASKMGDKKMGAAKPSAPGAATAAAPLKKVVVNTCPIMGGKVAGEGAGMSVVDNYEVHFCCAGCKPAFDKMTKPQQLEKVKAALAKK